MKLKKGNVVLNLPPEMVKEYKKKGYVEVTTKKQPEKKKTEVKKG